MKFIYHIIFYISWVIHIVPLRRRFRKEITLAFDEFQSSKLLTYENLRAYIEIKGEYSKAQEEERYEECPQLLEQCESKKLEFKQYLDRAATSGKTVLELYNYYNTLSYWEMFRTFMSIL